MSWVCDRHLDCTDGSDEAECGKCECEAYDAFDMSSIEFIL